MHRRQLLTACAAVVTAGCLGDGPTVGPTGSLTPPDSTAPTPTAPRGEPNSLLGEFRLVNATEQEHGFSLTVDDGETTLLDVDATLPGGGRRRFRDSIDAAGSYRFHAAVDAGAETTYEWTIPGCDDYDYLVVAYETDGFDIAERHHTVDPPPTCARR